MAATDEDPVPPEGSAIPVEQLGELLERNRPALHAYIRLNLPPDVRARESCSDVVQSVCRELVEAAGSFRLRGDEALRAWLFRTALNKIRDHAKYHRADRRASRHETADGDRANVASLYASIGTPSAHAIANEHAALVERAFDQLDPQDRNVILLAKIAALPRGEVAQVLGKSDGAVRTHLSRALARFGRELDRLGISF